MTDDVFEPNAREIEIADMHMPPHQRGYVARILATYRVELGRETTYVRDESGAVRGDVVASMRDDQPLELDVDECADWHDGVYGNEPGSV
jgi:hypothetical protein